MRNDNPYCETQRTFNNSRFIDLTRDYGFKIVMADDSHPELMLEFLNAVIPDRLMAYAGGQDERHRQVADGQAKLHISATAGGKRADGGFRVH